MKNIFQISNQDTGLKLYYTYRVVFGVFVIQIDVHPFGGVKNDGHTLNGIGKDDGLEHQPFLQGVIRFVNQANLDKEYIRKNDVKISV